MCCTASMRLNLYFSPTSLLIAKLIARLIARLITKMMLFLVNSSPLLMELTRSLSIMFFNVSNLIACATTPEAWSLTRKWKPWLPVELEVCSKSPLHHQLPRFRVQTALSMNYGVTVIKSNKS